LNDIFLCRPTHYDRENKISAARLFILQFLCVGVGVTLIALPSVVAYDFDVLSFPLLFHLTPQHCHLRASCTELACGLQHFSASHRVLTRSPCAASRLRMRPSLSFLVLQLWVYYRLSRTFSLVRSHRDMWRSLGRRGGGGGFYQNYKTGHSKIKTTKKKNRGI
jgi:hypothetical protein